MTVMRPCLWARVFGPRLCQRCGVNEAVYEELWRTLGKRKMSKFIEDLLRPHVLGESLNDGYKAIAQDQRG
jgi:hypothetical protein